MPELNDVLYLQKDLFVSRAVISKHEGEENEQNRLTTLQANITQVNLDDNTHPENVIIGPHFRLNLACPTVIFNPA